MPNQARGTENTAGPADRPPVRLANSCSIVEGGERHQRDRKKYSITVGVVSIDNGTRLQLVWSPALEWGHEGGLGRQRLLKAERSSDVKNPYG